MSSKFIKLKKFNGYIDKVYNILRDKPAPAKKDAKKKEFSSFTSFLREHQVPYCMDSGVLLGLMRDKKLLDHEKDIDLQMWIKDEEKLCNIVPLLREKGYRITIWAYRGFIYQYRILRDHEIPIHIMFFRKEGDWAWCPAGRATGNPFSGRLGKIGYKFFIGARKHLRERKVVTDVYYWPWRVRRDLGTWWVPARFFENVIYNSEFDIFIPEEWDEYLKYRYGNWRAPNSNWDFWRDDGALKQDPPEKLVNFSKYKGQGDGRQSV